MPSLGHGNDLAGFVREHAAHLLLPSPKDFEAPSREAVDGCGDEKSEKSFTRLPTQKRISDALWRSRHLPRNLYGGNSWIISDEHLALDEYAPVDFIFLD